VWSDAVLSHTANTIISDFCVISNAAVSGRPNALVTVTVWGPVLSYPVLTFFSILQPDQTAGLIFTLNGSNDMFPCKDGPFGG